MKKHDANELFLKGTIAFAEIERNGMRIDTIYLQKQQEKLTKKINHLTNLVESSQFYQDIKKFLKNPNPNLNSNLQLSKFLYEGKKIAPKKTTASGKGSTDAESLKQLNIKELNQILEIRKLKKLRDTYLESISREQIRGMIHPFFNLQTVRTFRSSSNAPNFQNLPSRDSESKKMVKSAIFPRIGHRLIELDFASLEVSIAACYHKDPNMLKYLKSDKSDMHGDIASEIFFIDDFNKNNPEHSLLRKASKNSFVFPQFYGDFYKNCAVNLCKWVELPLKNWKHDKGVIIDGQHMVQHLREKGIRNYMQFEKHIQEMEEQLWSDRFPVYYAWKNKQWKNYQKTGYIRTHTGFSCKGIMEKNQVINYPVQGAAFHCLLWSLIRINDILKKLKSRIVGQIHDSIIIDVHPFEFQYVCNLAKQITMQELQKEWEWIIVPLSIDIKAGDIDESWANLKPLKN